MIYKKRLYICVTFNPYSISIMKKILLIACALFAVNSYAMANDNTTTDNVAVTATQDTKVIRQFIDMMKSQTAKIEATKDAETLEQVMNACQVEINNFQTKNGAAIQKAMQSLSPEEQALIQAEVVQVATKYQETMVKKATEFGLM